MNKRHTHFNTSMESIVGVLGMIGGLIALVAAVKIVGTAAKKLTDAIEKGIAVSWEKLFSDKNEDPILVLEKTFLNDEWLDKQKFVEGSVTGTGIVGPLSTNGRFSGNPIAAFKKSQEKASRLHKDFWNKYVPIVAKVNAAWDKCVQMDDTSAAADTLVKMLKPLPLPGSIYSKDLSDIVGSLKVTEKYGGVVGTPHHPSSPSSLPALTRDQVKEVAKFVHSYFTDMKSRLGSGARRARAYDYEGNLPGDEEKSDDLWQYILDEPEAEHYSHNHHSDTWGAVEHGIDEAHAAAIAALMLYINRSSGQKEK